MRQHTKAYQRLIQSVHWIRLRRQVLQVRPLCADCLEEGVATAACEVHHIVPVETAVDEAGMRRLMFNPGNLVPLCHECHVRRHKELQSHSRRTAEQRAEERLQDFACRYFGADQDPRPDF